SLVPFYRLFNGDVQDHFYTTDEAERANAITRLGFKDEGLTGWVHSTPVCASTPLYRLYYEGPTNRPLLRDHFYTVNPAERERAVKNGYTYEGIAAYV
ncbi:hypothetical protein AURDEDRAFT_34421, partial [Auricularia subglabra TFB-10046 SS5]